MHIKTNNLYFLKNFRCVTHVDVYSYNEIPLSSHAGNYFFKKEKVLRVTVYTLKCLMYYRSVVYYNKIRVNFFHLGKKQNDLAPLTAKARSLKLSLSPQTGFYRIISPYTALISRKISSHSIETTFSLSCVSYSIVVYLAFAFDSPQFLLFSALFINLPPKQKKIDYYGSFAK